MNKKRNIIILISSLAVILIAGAGLAMFLARGRGAADGQTETPAQTEQTSEPAAEKKGLGKYSQYGIFENVPAMPGKDVVYNDAVDAGGGDYLIIAENTTPEDYRAYLASLEEDGFEKILDNGENGIEGYLYTSHYQKDGLLAVVSYLSRLRETTVTVSENTLLSDRLYPDAATTDHPADAATKLYAIELEGLGMGMFFQLKNGHFLLYDGGTKVELPHIVKYLESLVPEGEKPVIDAWFISHSHGDHMGVLSAFAEEKSYSDRIRVENVYFFDPSQEAADINGEADGVPWNLRLCRAASEYLKTADGGKPGQYRPRLGERYYIDDITIDVIYTPDLSPAIEWDTWNASSVVFMVTIDGQKVLLTGDSDWSSQLIYTSMFDKDYFDLTVYQVPHHGINVYKQITNRLGRIGTAIYPSKKVGGDAGPAAFTARKPQNEQLISLAEEAFAVGEGTRILTFPYRAGTAEQLPKKFGVEE